MRLKLVRDMPRPSCTLGLLYVDGVFECFTCEDVERPGGKVYGKTAIPRGHYVVVITPLARFKRDLPLLLNVPDFAGIRIHPGNTAADTEGCILPGRQRTDQSVTESRIAFAALFSKLQSAVRQRNRITIDITGPEGDQT